MVTGRRGDSLARRRHHYCDRVPLGPIRTIQAEAWVLVDAIHATS